MNPKIKTLLMGAAEAACGGFVVGLISVWTMPNDIILTRAGLVAAGTIAVKVGIVYLLGYLRQNVAFREVWTPERRAVEGGK